MARRVAPARHILQTALSDMTGCQGQGPKKSEVGRVDPCDPPTGKSCSVFRVRVVRDVSCVRSCVPARRYPGGRPRATLPCPPPAPAAATLARTRCPVSRVPCPVSCVPCPVSRVPCSVFLSFPFLSFPLLSFPFLFRFLFLSLLASAAEVSTPSRTTCNPFVPFPLPTSLSAAGWSYR